MARSRCVRGGSQLEQLQDLTLTRSESRTYKLCTCHQIRSVPTTQLTRNRKPSVPTPPQSPRQLGLNPSPSINIVLGTHPPVVSLQHTDLFGAYTASWQNPIETLKVGGRVALSGNTKSKGPVAFAAGMMGLSVSGESAETSRRLRRLSWGRARLGQRVQSAWIAREKLDLVGAFLRMLKRSLTDLDDVEAEYLSIAKEEILCVQVINNVMSLTSIIVCIISSVPQSAVFIQVDNIGDVVLLEPTTLPA